MEDKELTPRKTLWNYLKNDTFYDHEELWQALAIMELAEAIRSLKPEFPEYLQKIPDGKNNCLLFNVSMII